jgi:hypothetical protein
MARRKPKPRSRWQADRGGKCVLIAPESNTFPLAQTTTNRKRFGLVWLETPDAARPWGKGADASAKGRDKR